MFDTEALLKLVLALLAFAVTFFALVARDQKTPYLTTGVFSTVRFLLYALGALGVQAGFAAAAGSSATSWMCLVADLAWLVAAALVFASVLGLVSTVNRLHARRTYYRDSPWTLLLPWKLHGRKKKETYKHDPISVTGPKLIDAVAKTTKFAPRADELKRASEAGSSLSIACSGGSFKDVDEFLSELAMCFLQNDGYVQYTSCSRHPIELFWRIRKAWEDAGEAWVKVQKRFIAVDAYTPHFGFIDSIHSVRTEELRAECLGCVTSGPTYAGIHAAVEKAFNTVKKDHGKDYRQPSLVIYEGPEALTDLESAEQYKIFVKHVLPSERMWGGMMTVFVELENTATVAAYADLTVKLSEAPNGAP